MKKARTIANLEFKITFSETNIRHILGDDINNRLPGRISRAAWHKSEIQKDKEILQILKFQITNDNLSVANL